MERDKLISLVTNAQKGDQDALNDLFNAFYNDVYYFALKTVKDDQIACDITQETFVEIINTIGNLQEPAAFVKWMKQITYHQCTRYFKKKKDVIVDEDEDGNTIFDNLAEEKSEFIPDEALDKDEFKKTIMSMIDDLSEEQRAALMMFYYDELSIKQIAEIQGTNENTVKSRLNYAKKGIKKSVEDYEKKNGVKLHCVAVLPLLLWLFKDYFAQSVPASATVVAEGVAGATGTAIAITATTTTTVATTATTTAAVGIGAKIASLPIATKIIAGIMAAVLVIGGATTAVLLSNNWNNPNDNSSIVSTEGNNSDDTGTTSGDSTGTTDESTGSSDTTDSTETSTPATDSTEGTTNPEHKHSYTSKVTADATCGADGTTTFSCSCGDSYTEKVAATGQHTWGNWETVTVAFIGRDGTEKRTCTSCSATETKTVTGGNLNDSFNSDYGIDGIISNCSGLGMNVECITGVALLDYAGYAYEGPDRTGMDFEISSANLFAYLGEHFVLNDSQKASMKADSRYNSATDTFNLSWPGSNLNREVMGYVHNGGKNYTVYYFVSTSGGEEPSVYLKVEMEYNLPDGQPNRYKSIVKVESIPSNITK